MGRWDVEEEHFSESSSLFYFPKLSYSIRAVGWDREVGVVVSEWWSVSGGWL